VSRKGISVDPQKIEAVTQWPRPKNATQVRSPPGFTGYCRSVQNFSNTNLTRKITMYEWNHRCEEEFQELK